MTDFVGLLRALVDADVRFIVVGGVAATIHGSTRLTRDLDVVYARDAANLERLVAAIAPLEPYPRGAPTGLPFEWSVPTIRGGLNFTLVTRLGNLDLFGEIIGGGGYRQLLPETDEVQMGGVGILCLNLERLIAAKRAAGRPRDFETIAELEIIRDGEN